ncbi:nucleotide exchange factor GrpE [bacterium]|nr:nucleotide exchange factor GrpE [bacterium]
MNEQENVTQEFESSADENTGGKDVKLPLEEKWANEEAASVDETDKAAVNPENAEAPNEELAEACKQRDEYLHDLQRLQAEFDNFRKRTIRERSEMREFLLQEFIGRLLDVIDNLDRALNADANQESHEAFRDGVKMIQQQMMMILTDYGLQRINTQGEKFDPSLHEAMMQIESDEHEPGQIVSEFMPGYLLKERVLRAAKVQVAQASSTPTDNQETNES